MRNEIYRGFVRHVGSQPLKIVFPKSLFNHTSSVFVSSAFSISQCFSKGQKEQKKYHSQIEKSNQLTLTNGPLCEELGREIKKRSNDLRESILSTRKLLQLYFIREICFFAFKYKSAEWNTAVTKLTIMIRMNNHNVQTCFREQR